MSTDDVLTELGGLLCVTCLYVSLCPSDFF